MMKSVVILYHFDCADGFGAAWAAWKKFGNRAEYIAVNPREIPKRPLQGKNIYVVDNSYSVSTLKKLSGINKQVVVIDHHKSAEADVRSLPQNVFDIHHSGSVLAWRYFHPKKPLPWLLKHIEDLDLWKFKLSGTHELNALLDLFPYDFVAWNKLAASLEHASKRKGLLEKGRVILASEQVLIQRTTCNADPVYFNGYKAFAVNSPVFNSEICHELWHKQRPIGIVWSERHGKRFFSLRSDGSVDVSKLAAKFGGGGHPRSAGFTLSLNAPFPWKWLKQKKGNE